MRRLFYAVASAMAIALALSGCSTASHRSTRAKPAAAASTITPTMSPTTAAPTPSPSPTAFQTLTPDMAHQAFQAFAGNDDAARASQDERLALSWTTDGQNPLVAAEFRRAIAAGQRVPRYRYQNTVFYVPRLLPKGLQWFVIYTRRSAVDGKNPQNLFMAFVHAKPQQHWLLSLATVLQPKAPQPQIYVDQEGYATPLPTFDNKLRVQPRLVSSIQATLAEEGPSNIASKYMQDGTYSSNFYLTDQETRTNLKPQGFGYDVTYSSTSYPIFPLATANGGGFVLYGMNRAPVITRRSSKVKTPVPIPPDAQIFINPDFVKGELDIVESQQYGSLVPPMPTGNAAPGKIQIIAAEVAITKVNVPAQ